MVPLSKSGSRFISGRGFESHPLRQPTPGLRLASQIDYDVPRLRLASQIDYDVPRLRLASLSDYVVRVYTEEYNR